MWIAVHFQCMKAPLESTSEIDVHNANKLFGNKPVTIGYKIVKNPDYHNLSLGKEGYNNFFGEDCVEGFKKR